MKKNRLTLQQAADKSGVSLNEVRGLVAMNLLPTEDGLITLEDLLAVKRVKVPGKDEESLRNRVAILEKRLLEAEGMLTRLLQIAGVWRLNRDFTDGELVHLANLGEGGIEKFGQLRTDRIANLIDLVSVLSERELYRMEHLTQKKGVWIGLHTLLSDIIDSMTGRLEYAQNLDVQRIRMEAGMARTNLESQAKFLLALQDPSCDPDQLFGRIVPQSNFLPVGNRPRLFSIKDAVSNLVQPSESTGRCPGGE